jgi:hypothetical protein
MNVEGYEEEVLRGAEALLANQCLKVIELETVTPEIEGLMRHNEFNLAYYDPFSRQLSMKSHDFKSSNSLFIRDWPAVAGWLATAKKIEVLGHLV